MTRMGKASSPLRAGILGAGLMGQWHARFIRRAGGVLVAVADRNEDAARRLAARYPGATIYADADAMLRDGKLDVVHICTPLDSHAELSRLFLEAHIHTLIEKPLTPGAAETENLLALAASNNVLLCPVHQFAFQPGVLRAWELQKRLGQLRHIELVFCSAGGLGRSPDALDAIVADILPHPLSLLLRFLPGAALEKNWHCQRPLPGELRAAWNEDGTAENVTASVVVSMSARPTRCAFRLLGTEATLHGDLFHGYSYLEPGTVSRQRKIIAPLAYSLGNFAAAGINLIRRSGEGDFAYPGLRTLITQFYAAAQTGGAAPLPPQEILQVARLRDALMSPPPAQTPEPRSAPSPELTREFALTAKRAAAL